MARALLLLLSRRRCSCTNGGPATSARCENPAGVTRAAGSVYIADALAARVRAVNPAGTIRTFAGTGNWGFFGDGGAATSAWLADPTAVAVDAAGNVLIADAANSRVREVSTLGVISTIAGTGTAGHTGDGGPATAAQMTTPTQLAFDHAGNLLVSDAGNHTVRRISPVGVITTIAPRRSLARWVAPAWWATRTAGEPSSSWRCGCGRSTRSSPSLRPCRCYCATRPTRSGGRGTALRC